MTSTQHSTYWLDQEIFDDGEVEGTDIMRIARLAAVRRAISNFVAILSGENIPVLYSSGQQSYTDGKQVVISADDDPTKFDVMVGLALHEGSHVLLTDFSFLQKIVAMRQAVRAGNPVTWGGQVTPGPIFSQLFPAEIAALLPEPADYSSVHTLGPVEYEAHVTKVRAYTAAIEQACQDIQFLMNILEDRRIDKHVFTRAGGYRPYYQALYNKYFFTGEVGRNLRFNPKWREITVENYLNRLLYAFHPAAKHDALPGLEALVRMMDIQNIERVGHEFDPKVNGKPAWKQSAEFTQLPILWQEACKLYAYILKFTSMAPTATQQGEGEQGIPMPNNVMQGNAQKMPEALQGLPNLDGMPSSDEMVATPVEKAVKGKGKKQQEVEGKYNEKKAEKEMKDAKKVLQGEMKKKKLTKNDEAAVSALEAADAKMVDLKGDGIPSGKCMVTRKMNDQLLSQDWFIFKRWGWEGDRVNQQTERCIAAGKRMGQILVHRLQVRNDPMTTKQTRLQHGGLDRRLLAQLGMDITSVFQKSRIDTHKPAMLHLTLDASGSMSGRKWERVRTVAVALAYVGSKLRNVDTVISIRGGSNMPIVSIIFDSRKDQFTRFLRYIRKIEPNGATPEGLCFKATMDLITECATTHDVYFINFSDGEPAFHMNNTAGLVTGGKRRYVYGEGVYYSGETAYKHTRAMVNQMRDAGVKVLSYFISDYGVNEHSSTSRAFRQMYGEDAVFCNVENAAEVLRTLNKLLLKRGA